MKKKTLAWAVLPIAALLAACGSQASSSTSSGTSQPATESTSAVESGSTPAESSAEQPSTPAESSAEEQPSTPAESTEEQEQVEHLDAYGHIADGAELRTFDERFDAMVDDFSGNTLNGETDGIRHNGILRALVDSASNDFPHTTDDAIYKAASGSYEAMNLGANGIGFKMRVSRGKVGLKNLRLELRGGDSFQTYKIQLAEAMNSDNEELPELTDEFQDILVNPGQTIEDENTVYKNVDGSDSSTTVLGNILGFHLVANDIEVGGELEIAEVFTYAGTNRVVLDDFNRADSENPQGAWWWGCRSGFIVRRGVTLEDGTHYTTPALAEHQFLALNVLGDTSGTVLKGFDAQGAELASLTWANAYGNEAKLVAAANGEYGNFIVNLAQLSGNGILSKVQIVSATALELSCVFLTSLQLPQLDLTYPHITPTVTLDEFPGEIASLNDNWDASAELPANIDAGRTGLVSYAMGDQISVSGGSLNLPATDTYASVTIGYQATHLDQRAKYVVIAAKGDNLDLLRFKFRDQGSNDFVWFNAALAAEGVKAYGNSEIPSPYTDENGFTHYVIDLALNGLGVGDILDLYYTGSSPAQIGAIYFANADFAVTKIGTAEPAIPGVVGLDGYNYGGGISAAPGELLAVKIAQAGEGADFSTFRVQMGQGGETKWLNQGAISAYDANGRPILPTDKIPETGCEIFFDLSVFDDNVEQFAHFHMGGGGVGTIQLEEISCYQRMFVRSFGGRTAVDVANAYEYLGGYDMDASYDYLMISLMASGTNMTYESFRLASPETVIAFANNPETFSAIHYDGSPVLPSDVIPEDGETILLDVSESAITLASGQALHFHYAGWGDPVGTIQILNVAGASFNTPYELTLDVLPR